MLSKNSDIKEIIATNKWGLPTKITLRFKKNWSKYYSINKLKQKNHMTIFTEKKTLKSIFSKNIDKEQNGISLIKSTYNST